MAHATAEVLSALASEAVRDNGRFTIVLSGGSTPQSLFSLLAGAPYNTQLPWEQIHFYAFDASRNIEIFFLTTRRD